MDVVFRPADGDGLHFILPGDAAHEWPEPLLQGRADELFTVFGAEDAMKAITDVGVSHGFSRPSGT